MLLAKAPLRGSGKTASSAARGSGAGETCLGTLIQRLLSSFVLKDKLPTGETFRANAPVALWYFLAREKVHTGSPGGHRAWAVDLLLYHTNAGFSAPLRRGAVPKGLRGFLLRRHDALNPSRKWLDHFHETHLTPPYPARSPHPGTAASFRYSHTHGQCSGARRSPSRPGP